jgi:hypothetical protein
MRSSPLHHAGSTRALLAALALLTAAPAQAQTACEARCHRDGSECLKACTGAPKDAQKPDQGGRLIACLDRCEKTTQACKKACTPPPAPSPQR